MLGELQEPRTQEGLKMKKQFLKKKKGWVLHSDLWPVFVTGGQ